MQQNPPGKTTTVFKLDYSQTDKIALTQQNTLRILVGILGVLLPVLLTAFLFIATGYTKPLESISHYYYTRTGSIFTIILSLLAIFLLVYKGKEVIDFYVSSIAGIFALLVVLFPTSNISNCCGNQAKSVAVTTLIDTALRINFHYISAGIFLLCLAIMSLFLFTKSDKPVHERSANKKWRNRIYRICGTGMIAAILIIFADRLSLFPADFFCCHHLTFWMETVAVELFGISWLTKAAVIFKG